MWRNDTKYEYMSMFPLKNLARKGLKYRKSSIINTGEKFDGRIENEDSIMDNTV